MSPTREATDPHLRVASVSSGRLPQDSTPYDCLLSRQCVEARRGVCHGVCRLTATVEMCAKTEEHERLAQHSHEIGHGARYAQPPHPRSSAPCMHLARSRDAEHRHRQVQVRQQHLSLVRLQAKARHGLGCRFLLRLAARGGSVGGGDSPRLGRLEFGRLVAGDRPCSVSATSARAER